MAEIKWGRKAIKDLKLIYSYIAQDSALYADRFIDLLISRVDQLETHPNSGLLYLKKMIHQSGNL